MAHSHRYLVALGSNMRHVRYGRPRDVLAAAARALGAERVEVERMAPVVSTAPLGPSQRRYANSAAVVETELAPDQLLERFKHLERRFGRVRRGRRWGSRVLDLDIVLWSGGAWASRDLVVPHPAFRQRGFVLGPAAAVAPAWRDPLTGLTIRQLEARLTRPRSAPR